MLVHATKCFCSCAVTSWYKVLSSLSSLGNMESNCFKTTTGKSQIVTYHLMRHSMNFKLFTLVSFLTHFVVWGQTPKLQGNIFINVGSGQITCDFLLTNIPQLDDPAITLNRGFNVKDLKLNDNSIDYNIDWGFPGRTAFLSEGIGIIPNIDTILPTSNISISYTGAFPTYKENQEIASGDGMSVIAIKNNILRASHQSLWYPILVDRTNNFTITKYEYDINVVCKDCNSIYLGGTEPLKARKGNFQTTEPNDIMLYAGKYNFTKAKNTYFLNSKLDKAQADILNSSLDSIKTFYTQILQAKYSQPTVLAQIFTIGPKSQYEKWAFVVYPCIVADLNELQREVNKSTNKITDINTFRIYSHELAHNFFGLKVKADNVFWGFYSESFAEYLCLKAIENFYGKEQYIEYLNQRYLTTNALTKKFTPLSQIKSDISTNHLYNYYPMLLIGFEQIIGQQRMFQLLTHLVNNTKTTNLDMETLKKIALDNNVTFEEWNNFESNYVNSSNCLTLIKSKL